MDWISKNLLTLLAITIPVIVSIAIFVYQRRLNLKKLSYEILSNNNLANQYLKENKIKFLYEGNELDNLTLVVIKLINDGNKPITKDEFDKSIEIWFGEKSVILTVEIQEKHPTNLDENARVLRTYWKLSRC